MPRLRVSAERPGVRVRMPAAGARARIPTKRLGAPVARRAAPAVGVSAVTGVGEFLGVKLGARLAEGNQERGGLKLNVDNLECSRRVELRAAARACHLGEVPSSDVAIVLVVQRSSAKIGKRCDTP